jgi:hypothetical protein
VLSFRQKTSCTPWTTDCAHFYFLPAAGPLVANRGTTGKYWGGNFAIGRVGKWDSGGSNGVAARAVRMVLAQGTRVGTLVMARNRVGPAA